VHVEDEEIGWEQAQPLLDALRDPVEAVRVGALRSLVRMPLREEVWLDVGGFVWSELDPPTSAGLTETEPERSVPFDVLAGAAVYVPIRILRQRLYDILEWGSADERIVTSRALARARDAAAIPSLMAELSLPEADRWQVAESLSLLDLSAVAGEIRRICLEDEDGTVRIWLAMALARLGDVEGLESILLDMEAGTAEAPSLYGYGDPHVLAAAFAERGPYPERVSDLLREMSNEEVRADHLRRLLGILLEVMSHYLEGQADRAQPEDTESNLGRRAAEVAATLQARFSIEGLGAVSDEDMQYLAHLAPDLATDLATSLFSQAVAQYPDGGAFVAGNDIMMLFLSLPPSFTPHIPALWELYLGLGEGNPELGSQLAWTLSRAGLRPILAELAVQLPSASDVQRLAMISLVEEVVLHVRVSAGPIFGAGGTGVGDIPPIVEHFIEMRHEVAAVDAGGPPRKTQPRWLQGQLYEGIGDGERPLRRALRAGAFHRLVIRIGPRDEDWITGPEEAVVPVEDLPQDQEQYLLRVIFWEPDHVPEPLSDVIVLPRVYGPSTTCDFSFQTRVGVSGFRGRVVIQYGEGNRVLQSMLLVAQVVPDPANAPPEALIRFQSETAVRANLANLEAQQGFDVALVADEGEDGVPYLSEMTSERVTLRSLQNAQGAIKRIRRRLTRIAKFPDEFPRDLHAESSENLLRFLARQGSLLHRAIVQEQIGDSLLLNADRIQLVSAAHSFLPLEFLYDQPSPVARESRLCPDAAQALKPEGCSKCDKLDGPNAKQVICPLGFWCMKRVIERHAVRPVAESNLAGADYALEADPVSGRETLEVMNAAVYAASNRVDEEQIDDALQSLVKATDQQAERVLDWAAWCSAVQDRKPSLLVLMPHTLEDDDYIPTLEIGDEEQLAETDISPDHVRARYINQPPVVLLLGCETDVPDVPYQKFAAQFRSNGAAIVLSTLTPVLGRHAVPVAQILLEELDRAARADGVFGDAVLALRRRALAEGLLMVLSLVAYGDAGWRLHKETERHVSADEA
jgi:hypothetical protein